MQRVHVIRDFPQPVEQLFAHLSEQENLEPLFGAPIKRGPLVKAVLTRKISAALGRFAARGAAPTS